MKNKKLKILILSIILFIISFVFIVINGRTYTIKTDNINSEIKLDNNNIKIINKKIENNKLKITFKGLKKGTTFVELYDNGEPFQAYILYVHNFGVITNNNFLGYCNGSYIIPISIIILLIYILYICFISYRKSIKENLYQYKNIAYLGVILFLISLILLSCITINNYGGLITTIDNIIYSTGYFSFVVLPIIFVISILVTISNIKLIIKERLTIKNMLGLFLGLMFCIIPQLPDYIYGKLQRSQIINIYNLNSPGPYIYDFFESLVLLSATYLEFVLLGTIIMGIRSALHKPKLNKDYIIILGCGLKKDGTLTPLLKGRVDRALKFRNEQLNNTGKDLIFIPSGGKGNDEIISEAEAMKNYLKENGIEKKNILVEDKSKNTYENIKYSNKLIKKDSNVAFSTTNYHILRAGLIATSQNLKLEGMGSNTKSYFWINAFIREFIGTLYSEKKKHIFVIVTILIIIALMLFIKYYTNNI